MPSFDKVVNKATVSVPTTALGTDLLTAAEQSTLNMQGVVILTDIDIYLVDGTANGTAANSPCLCPAGASTVVIHKAGPLKAITASGTATVRVGIGVGHA